MPAGCFPSALATDPRASDDAGETPLHTAALYGHPEAAALLLRAGADPMATTDHGLTPRHWALLRDHAAVAALLPTRDRDRSLRWIRSVPRERTRIMPADPTAMLGRTLTVDGAPLDDGAPVDPPTSHGALDPGTDRLHTGIRVIDVCAPVIRGGTVTLTGPEGAGQLVVVAEIVHQLAERGGVSVLTDPETVTNAAGVTAAGSVTVAVLDVAGEAGTAALGEIDTRLVFDGALVAADVLPAISPSRSSSRLLDGRADEDAGPVAAAQAVREADEGAQRLHEFIRQPFHVAAPWTGQPGESVAFDQAMRQARTVR